MRSVSLSLKCEITIKINANWKKSMRAVRLNIVIHTKHITHVLNNSVHSILTTTLKPFQPLNDRHQHQHQHASQPISILQWLLLFSVFSFIVGNCCTFRSKNRTTPVETAEKEKEEKKHIEPAKQATNRWTIRRECERVPHCHFQQSRPAKRNGGTNTFSLPIPIYKRRNICAQPFHFKFSTILRQ